MPAIRRRVGIGPGQVAVTKDCFPSDRAEGSSEVDVVAEWGGASKKGDVTSGGRCMAFVFVPYHACVSEVRKLSLLSQVARRLDAGEGWRIAGSRLQVY